VFVSRFYIGGDKPGSNAVVCPDDPDNQRRLVFIFQEKTRRPRRGDACNYMDDKRQKRIETAVAWLGYSVVFLGLIVVLLLSLLRP
jgi:hypothetical protein